MNARNDTRIRRLELAKTYLALVTSQPDRPVALFAPLGFDKTSFLSEDVTRAAKAHGFLTVYCDLSLRRDEPIEAISQSFEAALNELINANPDSLVNASQCRTLPNDPAFRLDSLFSRLHAAHCGKVLLLLDQFQILGEHQNGIDSISTLRAALGRHKNKVFSIFVGSSQLEFAKMFSIADAPMYQFVQKVDLPTLD